MDIWQQMKNGGLITKETERKKIRMGNYKRISMES